MKSIDLGMKYGGMGELKMPDEKEEHYPDFHYSGPKELDIPHEGAMTIKYRKTRSATTERDNEPPRYECTFEVLSIESAEGAEEVEAPSKSYNDASDALDKLMKEMSGKKGKSKAY